MLFEPSISGCTMKNSMHKKIDLYFSDIKVLAYSSISMAQKRQSGDVLFLESFSRAINDHLQEMSDIPDLTTINELEFRIGNVTDKGFSEKFRMPVFSKVISYLREKYTKNPPNEELQLDISFDAKAPGFPDSLKKTRIRVIGSTAIGQFCRFNKIDAQAIIETKQKEQTTDMKDYGIRIQSSIETQIKDPNLSKRISDIISNTVINKYYRYKKRYTWIDTVANIRYDLTVIKAAAGRTFEASNVLKQPESYEIEIEYLKPIEVRVTPKTPVIMANINELREQLQNSIAPSLRDLIKICNDTFELISKGERNIVIEGYSHLIGEKGIIPYFIGLDPIALAATQLRFDTKIGKMPIEMTMATPKADGKRHLLYVYNGPEEVLKGKIYLINNRIEIFGTGLMSDEVGDLFDCELVQLKTGRYAILLFDTLFHHGKDLRCAIHTGSINSSDVNNKCKPAADGSNMALEDRIKLYNNFVPTIKVINTDLFPGQVLADWPGTVPSTGRIEVRAKEYWQLKIPIGSSENVKTPLWPNAVILNKEWDYNLDGIIFTPIGAYPRSTSGKSRKWLDNIKWKPSHQLSNDYLVMIRKDVNKKDIIYPGPGPGTGPGSDPLQSAKVENRRYKAVELYSFIQNKAKQKELVKFTADPPFKAEVHDVAMVLVEDDGTIRTEEGRKIIFDNAVIEFVWTLPQNFDPTRQNPATAGHWSPLRFREDKTDLKIPNHLDIARSNWQLIVSPITEAMITGKVSVPLEYYAKVVMDIKDLTQSLRSFHNNVIKRDMLSAVAAYVKKNININRDTQPEGIRMLDIGSGQGGDMHKWVGKNQKFPLIGYLVGIEKNLNNIHEAIRRYEEAYKKKSQIHIEFFNADASRYINNGEAAYNTVERPEESQRLQDFFLKEGRNEYWFDLISCQFALHYFTSDEVTFTTLLTNIFQNLKDGGLFFGTTMIGSEVFTMLKDLQKEQNVSGYSGQVKIWEITKQYSQDTLLPLGQQISIMFSSISNQAIPEHLVNFNYFFDIARKYGLVPASDVGSFQGFGKFSDLYNDKYNLTNDLKKYSFLNGYFILRKDQKIADELANVEFRAKWSVPTSTTIKMPEAALDNVPIPNAYSSSISSTISSTTPSISSISVTTPTSISPTSQGIAVEPGLSSVPIPPKIKLAPKKIVVPTSTSTTPTSTTTTPITSTSNTSNTSTIPTSTSTTSTTPTSTSTSTTPTSTSTSTTPTSTSTTPTTTPMPTITSPPLSPLSTVSKIIPSTTIVEKPSETIPKRVVIKAFKKPTNLNMDIGTKK